MKVQFHLLRSVKYNYWKSKNELEFRLLQWWLTTDHSPSASVKDNECEDWSTTLPEKGWLADCEYTQQIDIVESTLSAPPGVLGRSSPHPWHTNDYLFPRSSSAKRGKTTLTTAENSSGEVHKIDHANRSSIDRRRRRFLPIHSSLSDIIRKLNASEICVF